MTNYEQCYIGSYEKEKCVSIAIKRIGKVPMCKYRDCEKCHKENLEWLYKEAKPRTVNGDCETCKHYDEPKYCNNCYIRDDEMPNAYEPYIPEE